MPSPYVITCASCGNRNPIYRNICKQCGAIIRDRVPSIDLWRSFGQLIENPIMAFTQVLQAEQKNFATLVLVAALFKIYLISVIISEIYSIGVFSLFHFFVHTLVSIAIIVLIGYFLKFIFKKYLLEFRIKDFYAGIAYSFMPQLLGLTILFVLEFVVFGEQLFTFNPSPFLIRKNFAYLFSAMEIGVVIWNISLTSKVVWIYTGRKKSSFMFAIFFLGLIYLLMNIF